MSNKRIHIGNSEWTIEQIERCCKGAKFPLGDIYINKDLLLSLDEISKPLSYELYDYTRKEIRWGDSKHEKRVNLDYCEISNPYVYKEDPNASTYRVMIVSKNKKYGMIDEYGNTLLPIENDDVYPTFTYRRPYFIVKKDNIAYIYHILKYQIVSKIYDDIKIVAQRFPCGSTTDKYLKVYKNGKCGLVHEQGKEIVPPIYEDCYGSMWYCNYDDKHKYIIVTKDGKEGILNELGEIVAEIKYDRIRIRYPEYNNPKDLCAVGFLGSNEYILIDPCLEEPKRYIKGSSSDRPSYERYGGSYAQDEMGYSDDDIDTIFDGEPDAYWNID